MAILKEILDWSQSLPAWQSDALAHLFATGTLTTDDLDDLFALLKTEHGIPDPKGRKPNRLRADQIPVGPVSDKYVRILALKNLHHVNAIAEKQCLPFSPTGLTLIYGDNGSGKSGYARVLKCACRARDQREPIHPNALLQQIGKAEATFEIEVSEISGEVFWVYGQPAPEILSSLAVFDSRCARSYLDEEGDFAYVPYGLDILEGLASACKKLKGMIETEQALFTVDKTVFNELLGDTSVGKLIGGLSHNTSREQVEKLATVTPKEMFRRDELDKSLKESNPQEKAIQLRLCANRIAKIADRTIQRLVIVDDSAVTKLRGLVDDYLAAQTAAALAAQKFQEDVSLLPGTGGEVWKNLFQAARKFSIEAYPGMQFPDLGPDAQCPLCQQTLAEGAERLRRFDEFIQEWRHAWSKAIKPLNLPDEALPAVANALLAIWKSFSAMLPWAGSSASSGTLKASELKCGRWQAKLPRSCWRLE